MTMAISLQQLIFKNILATSQRIQLTGWLKNNTTGNDKIRAAVKHDWLVGDKTGGGDYGTTNDNNAVVWPTHHAPLVVAIYFTQ